MHFQTVTIQHIDRLSRDGFKSGRWLYLSFRLPDGTPKVWTVPGWPDVHEGMSVTVLLKRPLSKRRGDEVLGWISHADGKLAFFPTTPLHLPYVALSFAGGALLFETYQQDPTGPKLIFSIVFFALGFFGAFTYFRNLRIQKKLRGLLEHLSQISDTHR